MADIPTNLSYGTVYGRFILAYSDSSDEQPYPDAIPAAGSVFFTPSPNYILDASAAPAPVTILPATIEVVLDENGYLRSFAGPDGLGVRLVATDDPQGNPVNWTWAVEFRLTDQDGTPVRTISSFSFSLPTDSQIDLTTVTPVQAANGTYYIVGATGADGEGYDGITSTTSNPISTGLKFFTLNKLGALSFGQRVRLTDSTNNINYVEGQIVSIVGSQIEVSIDHTSGSGTYSSWNLGLTGDRGLQGPPGTLENLEVDSPITYSAGSVGFNWAATVLDDLGNVNVTFPTNGNMIKYNSTTSLWEKSSTIDGGTA